MPRLFGIALLAPLLLGGAAAFPTPDSIIAAAPANDWQTVNPADTLYMDIPSGRVVILLAPGFAPKTVANIRALAQEKYFDDSAIVRSQDNYVVQW
jgi:peptidylprolyl isomerase